MTMNVNLSRQVEAMVKAKVASGRYTSSSEVVREALRLMEPGYRSEKKRISPGQQ